MVHYNIKITGNVQRVGFRMASEKKARELGIKGFVRNERDGSVYMEAEGRDDAINKLITWAQEEFAPANVKNVEVEEGEIKNYQNFAIK